jgi:hypothetical protein
VICNDAGAWLAEAVGEGGCCAATGHDTAAAKSVA